MASIETESERRNLKTQGENKPPGGEGKAQPLADPSSPEVFDAVDAAGFRIMGQAGALPEEIAIKKQILELHETLKTLEDGTERRDLQKQITRLEMRCSLAEEARRRSLRG